jgi:tRNA U34 5-methylaminomethyl-2-thiouridine-forming methyltransferase MnmC
MLELVKTADGSITIYNAEVGENYHSKHGALQESRHVFLNSGLQYFLDQRAETIPILPPPGPEAPKNVSILEVGFGTGLNFLLSADLCNDRKINLEYTGIEAYPLSLGMISQTGYEQYISTELWQSFIANYEKLLQNTIELTSYCKLQIAHCKLLHFDSKKQYDIIYFDAFASASQPEMWSEVAISHAIKFLKPGGVFVTYAITGNLKRSLKALGCKVEKAPGAPGKREMLRAVKL